MAIQKTVFRIVLAQTHGDPHRKGIRKIECFSEEMFHGLKRLLQGVIFRRDESGITSYVSDERKEDCKERDKTRHSKPAFRRGAFVTIRGKEEIWWDREVWDRAYDLENPWGDLSIEQR